MTRFFVFSIFISCITFAVEACDEILSPYGGGNGTEKNPYLVCSSTHLNHIGDRPDLKYFKQTKDIDITNIPMRVIARFVGDYDGQGYFIKGLKADGSSQYHGKSSLAWILEMTGTIKNLNLIDFDIVGRAALVRTNLGIITASTFLGELNCKHSTEGVGIVAANNQGMISHVDVNANIQGLSSVGGVTGKNTRLGQVLHSNFSGNVKGGSLAIGGIAGRNSGLIYDSHVRDGSVKMHPWVGRAAGGVVGYNDGTIDTVSANADVYSEDSAGGIAGRIRGGFITRAKFIGNVEANIYAGGLIGYALNSTETENSYGKGLVSASHAYASLLGTSAFFKNSFFRDNSEKSYLLSDGSYVSDEQMKNPSSFIEYSNLDWLFDSIALAENNQPILAWEKFPPAKTVPDLIPVSFELFVRSLYDFPKLLVVSNEDGYIIKKIPFGRSEDSKWGYAVTFLPPGKYLYRTNTLNDLFFGDWCSKNVSFEVNNSKKIIDVEGINCPSYGPYNESVHPILSIFLLDT